MPKVILCLLFVSFTLLSCHNEADKTDKELTLDCFSGLSRQEYALNPQSILSHIDSLLSKDRPSTSIDRHVRDYYSGGNPLVWISRLGTRDRADTLLAFIRNANRYGLDTAALRVGLIDNDIQRLKQLDFTGNGNDINTVMARLEYNLTRAYFRYASGLRFGFVNPDYLYNNHEKYAVDSTRMKFRQLSDLRVERPQHAFYEQIIRTALNDSVAEFLSAIHPNSALYAALVARLNSDTLTNEQRTKTLCNLERSRWRLKLMAEPHETDKRIEVNIPSFSLHAIGNSDTLKMRVCCGTQKYKSPQLTSVITRMDVNPQWIVPKSIAGDYIGNNERMHRLGMFILDKKEGKLPPEHASMAKIASREQFLIQAGGPKNSLGRIVFRFANNFSVYLHDTSSPWLFQRASRAFSHGCIRVEKPYELALFLLNEKDEEVADRLKYSMTVNFVNDRDSLKKLGIDRNRLINSRPVKPAIPLSITYYTTYFDESGRLTDFKDIYGYDGKLAEQLRPFVK